eukprot:8331025-Pyramimonas_sp.AAC.1
MCARPVTGPGSFGPSLPIQPLFCYKDAAPVVKKFRAWMPRVSLSLSCGFWLRPPPLGHKSLRLLAAPPRLTASHGDRLRQ